MKLAYNRPPKGYNLAGQSNCLHCQCAGCSAPCGHPCKAHYPCDFPTTKCADKRWPMNKEVK